MQFTPCRATSTGARQGGDIKEERAMKIVRIFAIATALSVFTVYSAFAGAPGTAGEQGVETQKQQKAEHKKTKKKGVQSLSRRNQMKLDLDKERQARHDQIMKERSAQ
jgi:hypothetical protein